MMVSLINMPFASLYQPSLALGQFKAQLNHAGLPAHLFNFNFDLARLLGFERYEPLNKFGNIDMRLGEWLFSAAAWGNDFGPDARGFIDLCRKEYGSLCRSDMEPARLDEIRSSVVPQFLDNCCEQIFFPNKPVLVAFSCVFFQTVPAIALARAIKERHGDVVTLFGGPSFFNEMGIELLRKTPWIDAAATGEADQLIVPAVTSFLRGEPPLQLPGLAVKGPDGSLLPMTDAVPASSQVLESLPDPDYSDYVGDMQRYAAEESKFPQAQVYFPFEGSRGCWWGEKQPCSFCGLNPTGMVTRSKSPQRVLGQLKNLVRLYPARRFFAADNNLPLRFIHELLPELAKHSELKQAQLFCEVMTNVRREWIRNLAAAGFKYLQPGIETLSTPLLKAMHKGVTALQNVYFLKLCRSYGIFPLWNFLIRIPGEKPEDYTAMCGLLPKIVHFNPPSSGARLVQAHRFSLYANPEAGYLDDISPQDWYAGLFPSDRFDLQRIAYYLTGRWRNTLGQGDEAYQDITAAILKWVDVWRTSAELPDLCFDPSQTASGLTLYDSRSGQKQEWCLDEREAFIFKLLDDPRTVDYLEIADGGRCGSGEEIASVLTDFVANGLVLREGNLYLGLAVPATAKIAAPFRHNLYRRYLD